MAGKSSAAAKGRAKLEAFKAARAKKALEEAVPIDEPKPRPAAVAEPAPAVVKPPTKPDVDARFAVPTWDVPRPPSVPESPPLAPRACPEDSSFPGDADASAGSLSSAYAALSDAYLPPTRAAETLDAPRSTLGEAPGSLALARDAGTVGAGTLGNAEKTEHATSDPVLAPVRLGPAGDDDLEPPPFVSPFKPEPTAFERRRYVSSANLEPFKPAIESSTLLSRFETRDETRDAASATRARSERSVVGNARVSGGFLGPSFADDEGRRLAEASEVEALQRVIDDMTRERMAFQRGLDKQQELMQTLAEENERFATERNARAEELARLRDANSRATAAVRARDDALALAVEARDVAKAEALDAYERAARSALETVELEEKLRAARAEALELRGEMEREMTDRERRDRAARAATADRDEMATTIEGFRREREFLRAKLRDAAAREERDMERDLARRGRAAERDGDDDDDSDEEGRGSALKNTPAREMEPRARAARLAADLEDARGGGSEGEGDFGTPGAGEKAPSGFFHFVSRSANGARATGGVPVGDVGEDQLRLVDSIHELLSEVERERARAKRALEAAGEKTRSLEATNAALERRLAGKRELEGEAVANDRASVSRSAVSNGGDAADADVDDVYEGFDGTSRDEDAWSDDDDEESTPRRRRGFFSSLNPFARR